jgi:hypothetical protein
MPRPELSQGVIWYDGGLKQNARAAIVSKIDFNTICVNIVDPNLYSMPIKDGVHHMEDYDAKEQMRHDNGCWDFTEQDKRIRALLAAGSK